MKKNNNKKKIINDYLKFFKEKGIPATKHQGKKLPLDPECTCNIQKTWSENVYFLSKSGLHPGYFRGDEEQYTISGFDFHDLYKSDCELLINKFITYNMLHQLKQK